MRAAREIGQDRPHAVRDTLEPQVGRMTEIVVFARSHFIIHLRREMRPPRYCVARELDRGPRTGTDGSGSVSSRSLINER